MTTLSTFWHLIAALALAALAGGCGGSSLTVPLETHQSVTDSLKFEIVNLKAANGTHTARLARFDEEKRVLQAKTAELESTITFLKEQIGRAPATAPPAAPPVADASPSYERALELFRAKNYEASASTFQSILDAGSSGELEDNCRYWLGECLFGAREYARAIDHFRKLSPYEKSEKKDESQLMIARSYAKLGQNKRAKLEYQKLVDTFPASPYLKQAKEQMGRLK
jgi:TolA-binding protein